MVAAIKGKKINIHKAVSVLMAVVMIISALMVVTLAWTSSQHRLNVLAGGEIERTVTLQKVEVDANGEVVVPNNPVANAVFALYRINDDGTETRIGTKFTTDVDGRIVIPNIEPGNYVWVEISPPRGWDFDIDENGDPITRYYFTVRQDDVNITVHAFNRRMTGDLTVTKTVENENGGNLTQEQRDQAFEFTVRFYNLPDHTVTITMNGDEVQISPDDNEITFTLRHGESMVFEGIPTGVDYVVTEQPVDGFRVQSNNHQGTITDDDRMIIVDFTNIAQFGEMTVTKTVVGNGADLDKEFEFTVTFHNLPNELITIMMNGNPVQVSATDNERTFTLAHGEAMVIGDLPFGTTFTVVEGDYTAYGYITSPPGGHDGTVNSGNQTFPFVNTYDDESDDPGHLLVRKTTKGDDADLTKAFAFTVTFGNLPAAPVTILMNGTPVTLSDTNYAFNFTLAHNETMLFENIPAGVTFTVEEEPHEDYFKSIRVGTGVINEGVNIIGDLTIAPDYTIEVEFINERRDPPMGEIVVTKIVEGDMPDPDQRFRFRLVVGQGVLDEPLVFEFDLAAGESSEVFTAPVDLPYIITEIIPLPDGFSLIWVERGQGTTIEGRITAEFTNRFDGEWLIDIEGEKTWVNPDGVELPEYITVRLMDGDRVVAEVEVRPDANGEWHFIFENLPKYDADGNEIEYTVVEVPIDGWIASYCDCCGFDIVNTELPPYDPSVFVEKIIVGGGWPADAEFRFVLTGLDGAPMPHDLPGDTAIVTVTGEGIGEFSDITFRRPGTFVYTIHEVDTAQDGFTYDTALWTVTFVLAINDDGELYVQSTTYARNGAAIDEEIATFTNEFESDYTEVRVTKVWNDNNNPNRPTSVQVQLLRNGVAYGELVTLNAANNWTHLWTGLERGPVWTVYEPNVPAGYTKSISGDAVNGWIITNTREDVPPTTSVSVRKVWNDDNNPNRPTSVQVQLRRNGVAHGNLVTLNAANNWQFTWTGLEVGPTWTVYEPNVPAGYTKSISGNATSGFTITNTLERTPPPGRVIVEGRKYWNHLNNPVQNRPTSITVFIYANGELYRTFLLTAENHWRFSFELAKYDSNGNEIVYTVNEARIYDYTKRIDGWNIHNRFHPGTHTDLPYIPYDPQPPLGDSPQTGDSRNLGLWLSLMIGSASVLTTMLVIGAKKNRRFVYEGQYLKK
ncbi:MAG: Cna B-type domain-containing protein [Oscillospiraceae bacterium]|nr:Cna B-type domain-containing protein [Oscillospiraceae bacterium]